MKRSFVVSLIFLIAISSLSFCSAPEADQNKEYQFLTGYSNQPHDDKKESGGEDSWEDSPHLLAVADGVGGWSQQGVDAGKYSKSLCQNVAKLLRDKPDHYLSDVKSLLTDAWKKNYHKGSSTFVMATLPRKGTKIHTINVGDSGYAIFRRTSIDTPYKLIYESEIQQKGFNFPYQLGAEGNGDTPEVGAINSHELLPGDMVILASDGVLDNLEFKEIPEFLTEMEQKYQAEEGPQSLHHFQDHNEERRQRLAQKAQEGKKETKDNDDDSTEDDEAPFDMEYPPFYTLDTTFIADSIKHRAYELSKDPKHNSPFSKSAKKHGKRFDGGKEDDITVVVGILTPSYVDDFFELEKDL